jgi:membrane protein
MIPADGEIPSIARGGALRRTASRLLAFGVYSLRRFSNDGCFAASGALSYTTLVSLVPLGVIVLGSLSAFPIFAPARDQLLAFVFRNFVPRIGEQAAYWFRTFAASAGQTTAIGFIGFAASGILLLTTIEDRLNVIWRVTASRPWVQRVLAYWALITLGPILLGTSVTLSTYFEIAAQHAGIGQQAIAWFESAWLRGLARVMPSILEFIAFTLLYCLIPNCAVRWRDAALGAVIATVAIEILKVGFSLYLGASSFYQTVYGALAAVPIFLLWMYVTWNAVLLGAIVAAALPNWHIDEGMGSVAPGGVRLGFSLALLAALARAQWRGETVRTPALARELEVATTVIDEHMQPLVRAGFAAQTQEGRWVLARNPENATLADLYDALRLPLAGRWLAHASTAWQRQAAPAMRRIVEAESAALRLPLAALIAEVGDRSRTRPTLAEPGRRRGIGSE